MVPYKLGNAWYALVLNFYFNDRLATLLQCH
jgi:hypothetical protein